MLRVAPRPQCVSALSRAVSSNPAGTAAAARARHFALATRLRGDVGRTAPNGARCIFIAAAREATSKLQRWRYERQLAKDPGDVVIRHKLARELAVQYRRSREAGVDTRGDPSLRQLVEEHYDVALRALQTRPDPELTHMITMALLSVKEQAFYSVASRFMVELARHPICLEEFRTKSEFQERATQYHFASALNLLKVAGEAEAARLVFEEATSLRFEGDFPIQWDHLWQTPAIFLPGLRPATSWWDPAELPVASVLRENFAVIREDLEALLRDAQWPRRVLAAYPTLTVPGGRWDMLPLYNNRCWNEGVCALMPRAAELLRGQLPGAAHVPRLPYIVYNSEEVTLFRTTPGTKVLLHNGGVNARLNVSLGLKGCAGAWLEVAGERREWRAGEVLAFDDSVDHAVHHLGEEDRWVLTVGVMHPDLVAQPWIFGRCFTGHTEFEKLPAGSLETLRRLQPCASS